VIVTVGDLIEDIVVWAEEGFQPDTDTTSRIVRTRGGSAANVAAMVVVCGGRSRYVGNVGTDDVGDRLVASLEREGVEVAGRRGGRTGTLVAIVGVDGERSFFTDRGASSDLRDADPRWLDGARALHVPAYCFDEEPMATTATHLVELAHARDLVVTVDCSSTSLIARFGVGRFTDLLESLHPTAVLANRDEALALGLGEGAPAPGAVTTIVRQGGERTLVVGADGTTTEVPVPPVTRVVDTTGAGDAFAAGWLVATVAGAAPADATIDGHRSAALVLDRAGAAVGGSTP